MGKKTGISPAEFSDEQMSFTSVECASKRK
jgi:hypothetical protein